MISPDAVKRFLKLPRDDWDEVKRLNEEELDSIIADYEVQPQFYTKPYRHQKACFILGATLPHFLFLCGLGSGKTRIALDIVNYHQRASDMERALVVVPNAVLIASWEAEAAKHTPDLNVLPLHGTTEQRWKEIKTQPHDVGVVNYQGLSYMASMKAMNKSKTKRSWQPSKEKIEYLSHYYDGIVFDEIHTLKNWQSLTYQICNALSDRCQFRYGLTGTPFGREAQDLWAQFHAVDKGETLGYTLGIFREAFFNSRKGYFGGYEYKLRKDREDDLHRFIKHRSIRFRDEEVNDLPPRQDIAVPVEFTDEGKQYRKETIDRFIEEKNTGEVDKEASFVKLRQIASGFITLEDDQGNRHEIEFTQNPKLNHLDVLIDALPDGCKAVVFHEFNRSGEMICELLTKRSIGHSRLWGGTKDPPAVLHDFQTNTNTKVLVANSKSGGAGLNLQVANYMIFFESPVSPIVRQQAERRCHRDGQQHSTVFLYDLYVAHSIEEKILRYLSQGEDLLKAVVDGRESLES